MRLLIKYISYKAADVLNYTMKNGVVWCQLFSKDLMCLMYKKYSFHLTSSICLPASFC
jgi:hypothetical protein